MLDYGALHILFQPEQNLTPHRHDVNPDAMLFGAMDNGATEFEYMQLLYALVGIFKPTHALETGTWTGSSAIALMSGSENGLHFWTFNDHPLDCKVESQLKRTATRTGSTLHVCQHNTFDLMAVQNGIAWSSITGSSSTFAYLDSSLPARALEFEYISNPANNMLDFSRPLCVCVHDMSRYRHPNNPETNHLAWTIRRIMKIAGERRWQVLRLHQSRGMMVLVKYPSAVGIDGECIVPQLLLDPGDMAQAEAGHDPYLITEYYPILADLVAAKRPKRILEIGVRYGYSLGVMLDAADSVEAAFAIDVTRVPNDQSWWGGAEGSFARAQVNLEELRTVGRWPNLSLLRFFDKDTSLLNELPAEVTNLDFAYVDGGHSVRVCRHDLELVGARMNAGGVIVVDDADHDGLRETAENWAAEQGFAFRYIPDSSGRGRVVIDVTEAVNTSSVVLLMEQPVENDTLTVENCIAAAEAFIDRLPPYPGGFDGRGIVMCAGGVKYFTCAWVAINLLRHLGCTLPIQVWHLGAAEMSDEMSALLRPLGVECVDALEIRKQYPCRILNGWEVKAYSILHSPFREVMLLDSDNLCVRDPTYLFESSQYKETGAIFWPDRGRYDPYHGFWRISGLTYQDEPEFESGQIVVDKERYWAALRLSLWYNEQSDFFYRHLHGDKDTFHMAFRKLGAPYIMAQPYMDDIPPQFHQRDPEGNLLFVHGKKWEVTDRQQEPHGYPNEEFCVRFFEQLANVWDGRVNATSESRKERRLVTEQTASAALAAQRLWIYGACLSSTPIVFAEGGRIERGASEHFRTWKITAQIDGNWLEINGVNGPSCRLRQMAPDVWAGPWINDLAGYIELGPLPKDHLYSDIPDEEWFAVTPAQ